ncbi:hypothetical protein Pan216_56130 [Planctomycetes bacterium Pan216]|uniref:Uncharacterized protein n=1 Tax=Kolteria novifilia TaxID=2527975 RepID=A0A518BCK9_9BACT|nr:hypothetical protein Pan216_56130 [Planctomycetes bacterium Pan216]
MGNSLLVMASNGATFDRQIVWDVLAQDASTIAIDRSGEFGSITWTTNVRGWSEFGHLDKSEDCIGFDTLFEENIELAAKIQKAHGGLQLEVFDQAMSFYVKFEGELTVAEWVKQIHQQWEELEKGVPEEDSKRDLSEEE